MTSINITIPSEEFEITTIELTEEEVRALYLLRMENSTKLKKLAQELTDKESTNKYLTEQLATAKDELLQGHTLLTALGIPAKTSEEEVYYRRELQLTTRIALYLAEHK